MVRIILPAMLAFLLSMKGLAVAQAGEHRVALVIGNGKYLHARVLDNPVNDAQDIGNALQQLGFDVWQGTDLTKAGFDRILTKFKAAVANADVALIFYAGHGAQIDGINYLIPVDMKFDGTQDLTTTAPSLQDIQAVMDHRGAGRIKLLLFDACRDNPFLGAMAGAGRHVKPGWASPSLTQGTYLSFASAKGEVAADGPSSGLGQNSPFTAALLKHLPTPGLDVRIMMGSVREDVIKATSGAQVPWAKESLLRAGFVFAKRDNAPQITLTSDKLRYKAGDGVRLYVKPSADCRLTLISSDERGGSCLLFPDPHTPDIVLKAGQTFIYPPQGQMTLSDPGKETFKAMCNTSQAAKRAPPRRLAQSLCSQGGHDRAANDKLYETAVVNWGAPTGTAERITVGASPAPLLQSTLTVTVRD